MASPASASVAARSIASARSGTTLTRSSPKTSAAARPSAAADMERGVEFWVHTRCSRYGSKAASRPSWSLSSITPITPTSGLNENESSSAAAAASAPCGLCAASSRIVGLRRMISSRPGEVTSANAARTRSSSSSPLPNASTAASATAAFCAWWAP